MGGGFFNKIVDRDSLNLYPLYPLFPCSDFVSQLGGGGGCNVFLTFYAVSMFLCIFFCMLEILKSAPSLTATG